MYLWMCMYMHVCIIYMYLWMYMYTHMCTHTHTHTHTHRFHIWLWRTCLTVAGKSHDIPIQVTWHNTTSHMTCHTTYQRKCYDKWHDVKYKHTYILHKTITLNHLRPWDSCFINQYVPVRHCHVLCHRRMLLNSTYLYYATHDFVTHTLHLSPSPSLPLSSLSLPPPSISIALGSRVRRLSRVMVGVIILYDHVHPVGAFAIKATIDVSVCVCVCVCACVSS